MIEGITVHGGDIFPRASGIPFYGKSKKKKIQKRKKKKNKKGFIRLVRTGIYMGGEVWVNERTGATYRG